MTPVEVGQIWKHDSGKSGLTIWEITEVYLNPDVPYCKMKMVWDRDPDMGDGGVPIQIGEQRQYPLYLFGEFSAGSEEDKYKYWDHISREDVPLLMLAGLP